MRFWRSCPFRNRPGLVSAPGLRWLLVPAFRLPKLQSLNTFNFGFDWNFQAFVAIGDYNGHVGLGVKCSKEVATAIRGAIILAKLSIIPVRRGYWGNKIGKPHTVPCKVRCLKFEMYFAVVKILTDVFKTGSLFLSGDRSLWFSPGASHSRPPWYWYRVRSRAQETADDGWYWWLLHLSQGMYRYPGQLWYGAFVNSKLRS